MHVFGKVMKAIFSINHFEVLTDPGIFGNSICSLFCGDTLVFCMVDIFGNSSDPCELNCLLFCFSAFCISLSNFIIAEISDVPDEILQLGDFFPVGSEYEVEGRSKHLSGEVVVVSLRREDI